MKKRAIITAITLLVTLAALPPVSASALTTSGTVYSSETDDTAYKDFALPGDASNISVSVNTGSVLSHGRNANGTYRVTVGGGSVKTTTTLTKDADAEHLNVQNDTYNSSGVLAGTTYSWDNHYNHPTLAYNEGGYTGTLNKWKFTETPGRTYASGVNTCKETIYTGYYKGVVSKQANVYAYNITVTYTSGGGGETTPTPVPDPTPVQKPSETYTVAVGDTLYVPIRAVDTTTFAGRTFTITYPNSQLTFTGFQSDSFIAQTAAGAVPGTDLTIASHNGGTLKLTCSKTVPAGTAWTGTIAVLVFNVKSSGTVTVSVSG